MIVLDTNIVSELMKPQPHQGVRQWINAQALETLYLTSVSWFELLHGLELMPEGRRQTGLREVLHKLRDDFFMTSSTLDIHTGTGTIATNSLLR